MANLQASISRSTGTPAKVINEPCPRTAHPQLHPRAFLLVNIHTTHLTRPAAAQQPIAHLSTLSHGLSPLGTAPAATLEVFSSSRLVALRLASRDSRSWCRGKERWG